MGRFERINSALQTLCQLIVALFCLWVFGNLTYCNYRMHKDLNDFDADSRDVSSFLDQHFSKPVPKVRVRPPEQF